jgi:hypothetical protein
VRAEWRKPAIGAGVLALHALLALVLIRMQFAAPAPPQAEHEITLLLMPAAKPPKLEENKTPTASTPATRTAPAFSIPKEFTASPNAITLPENHALDGVGASLGCGASNYDALDPEHRANCGSGPWAYNKDQRETASLIIKAPRGMTPMERAERIRSTADPCGAEKLTHQNDCIDRVIHGDRLP